MGGQFYTDNELQYHGPQQQQPRYSYRQPQHQSYLPQSDYHKLQQKLSTNDQLRSYIKTLRQQLNEYKNIVPHDHERGTTVDLNQYDSGSLGLKVLKNYKPNLDTDKWLRNRQNNNYRQHERKAPIRF